MKYNLSEAGKQRGVQIENLKAQMQGKELNIHQKADALIEFNRLLDYVEELEKSSTQCSYGIVRWYDNVQEDVVCVDKATAEKYVSKYNKLAGDEKCYVDDDVWLPLNKV